MKQGPDESVKDNMEDKDVAKSVSEVNTNSVVKVTAQNKR